jgi:hypothetical protein
MSQRKELVEDAGSEQDRGDHAGAVGRAQQGLVERRACVRGRRAGADNGFTEGGGPTPTPSAASLCPYGRVSTLSRHASAM